MRGVREVPAVQAAADDAFERWVRAEDAWDSVKWLLARDPTIGDPLSEGGRARTFTYDGAIASGMPTIAVLYEFDDQHVTIVSAKFADARNPQAGHARVRFRGYWPVCRRWRKARCRMPVALPPNQHGTPT